MLDDGVEGFTLLGSVRSDENEFGIQGLPKCSRFRRKNFHGSLEVHVLQTQFYVSGRKLGIESSLQTEGGGYLFVGALQIRLQTKILFSRGGSELWHALRRLFRFCVFRFDAQGIQLLQALKQHGVGRVHLQSGSKLLGGFQKISLYG